MEGTKQIQAEETRELKKKLKNIKTVEELIKVFEWAYQETSLANNSRATCFRSVRSCVPQKNKGEFIEEAERRLARHYHNRWNWTGD